MENFEKIEEPDFITADELAILIKNVNQTISDAGSERTQSFEEQNNIYEQLIETLLKEKERFANIFRTEKGSIYFVLANGQSMRIKKTAYSYELQPFADHIEYRDQDNHIATELSEGTEPFETFLKNPYQPEKPLNPGQTFSHLGHKIIEIIK